MPQHVERSLDTMVSRSAVSAGRPLVRARRSCAGVQVLSLHAALRDRQTACVQVLDTYAGFLRSVAADGSRAAGEWPEGEAPGC
jgi:hypothetical protein